jgi:hypothetical protein
MAKLPLIHVIPNLFAHNIFVILFVTSAILDKFLNELFGNAHNEELTNGKNSYES